MSPSFDFEGLFVRLGTADDDAAELMLRGGVGMVAGLPIVIDDIDCSFARGRKDEIDGASAANMPEGSRPVGVGPSWKPTSAARTRISREKGLELLSRSWRGDERPTEESGVAVLRSLSSSSASSAAVKGSEDGMQGGERGCSK